MKVEVDLTITNPITSNNFRNWLADLRVGYSHPHGGTLYASLIITSIVQYSKAAPSFSFHLFIHLALLPAGPSSWQRMFFIYFRVLSHEFVSASLRKPCGFSPWFLTGIPLILFLKLQLRGLQLYFEQHVLKAVSVPSFLFSPSLYVFFCLLYWFIWSFFTFKSLELLQHYWKLISILHYTQY